jgi:hypothetical protein
MMLKSGADLLVVWPVKPLRTALPVEANERLDERKRAT